MVWTAESVPRQALSETGELFTDDAINGWRQLLGGVQ
jgi:hypothetical protein